MARKRDMAAVSVVMLALMLVVASVMPRGLAASGSTTFGESVITQSEYRNVYGELSNLSDFYERYIGVTAGTWELNITFPDFAWNDASGANANATYFESVNIMISNVRFNSSNVPFYCDDTQTALWLELSPGKTTPLSYVKWVNGTGTMQVMGDSFTWDNNSISIYAAGSSITNCRNATTSGAHNDTWSITAGMSSILSIQPKYLYYWTYQNTGVWGKNGSISAGSITFTFSGLNSTQALNLVLSDTLSLVIEVGVLTTGLGLVVGAARKLRR